MASTIAPVVYRNTVYQNCKWAVSAGIYTIGSVIGAVSVGTFLGMAGMLIPATGSAIGAAVAILIAFLYSLHELKLLSLPYAERKKQVPLSWRTAFHPYISSGLYGLVLGAGVATFIPTATFHVFILAAVLSGSLGYSILLFSIFGITRALPVWLAGKTAVDAESVEVLGALVSLTKPILHQFNGALLAAYAAFLLFQQLGK